jgi:hypothetical protein
MSCTERSDADSATGGGHDLERCRAAFYITSRYAMKMPLAAEQPVAHAQSVSVETAIHSAYGLGFGISAIGVQGLLAPPNRRVLVTSVLVAFTRIYRIER